MKTGMIIDGQDKRILLHRVHKTTNGWDRLRGFLVRKEPDWDEGLLITPCNSVHMFFMLYSLDIIFLDAHGTVTSIRTPLQPWRVAAHRQAVSVLELKAGQARRLNIFPGTTLLWQ